MTQCIENYTDGELVEMDDDELERVVQYTCAERGIPLPPPQPEEPEAVPAAPPPSVFTYEVFGVHFLSEEDAQKALELVSHMLVARIEYERSPAGGYDYFYKGTQQTDRSVARKGYCRPDEHVELQARRALAQVAREDYDKRCAERSAVLAQRTAVRTEVLNAAKAARHAEAEDERWQEIVREYLRLADFDYVVARRFFEKAYPGQIEKRPQLESLLRPGREAIDPVLAEDVLPVVSLTREEDSL